MNQNVKIADDTVGRIRAIIIAAMGKKVMPVPTDTLLATLESLERLAVLERHLYNLTSQAYHDQNNRTQPNV